MLSHSHQDGYYFDANANMPLSAPVQKLLAELMMRYGNASATHIYGQKLRAIIEKARDEVADFFDSDYQVIFTSGATEANNLWARQIPDDAVVLMAVIEHPSILEPIYQWRAQGGELILLPIMPDGCIDIETLGTALHEAQQLKKPIFLTVQAAHSETGVVQNMNEIIALAKNYDAIIHCDMVQLLGKYPFAPIDYQGLDYITLSAHKIGGMMGAGALLCAKNQSVKAQLLGGTQENRHRAGTENFMAIACFAEALKNLPDAQILENMLALREKLSDGLSIQGAEIVAQDAPRLYNTLFAIHPSLEAQQILMQLDLAGVFASGGSACSSGKISLNQTLLAMGIKQESARNAIRFSFHQNIDENAVVYVIETWKNLRL